MPKKEVNIFKQMNEARSDYNAAKETKFLPRLSGVNHAGSGADYHYRNERDRLKMVERANELLRNDSIAVAGVDRLCSNVLMDGFPLDINTGDRAIDVDLKAGWKEWGDDPDQCHSEGEFTWSQMERLGFRSTLTQGDIFFLPLKAGSLQAVESHRVRTPYNTSRDVIHGILLDQNAKRQEVWITKEDLSANQRLMKVSEVQQYRVRDPQGNRQVFHIYFPSRFSQRRGVTCFAPNMETLYQHGDLTFSTLVKAQMSALVTLTREVPADALPGVASTPLGPVEQIRNGANGEITELQGIGCGLDITSRPGEKLQFNTSNIPGPGYFDHSYQLLAFVAASLGIPVAVLLLDPQKSGSFSAWRGAIDQARGMFKIWQKDFRDQFHTPVYKWWLRRRLASDPILRRASERSDIHIFRHTFNCPSWPYIEPLKDAQADLIQLEGNLSSHTLIAAARGRDWEDLAAQIVKDNVLLARHAIEAAEELNELFPKANINWRELLNMGPKDRALGMQNQAILMNDKEE